MSILAGPGDPVGGVPDLSGGGAHATQGTSALKPTLVASAFPSGRSGLSFDGVDDRLLVVGVGATLSGDDVPFTIGLVYRVTDSTYRAMQGLGNGATATPYTMLYSVSGTTLAHYRRDNGSVATTLSGPAVTVNATQVVVASFGEMPGVTARTIINGTLEQSGAMDVGTMTVDRFIIGAAERAGTVLYPFKGYIGAWAVYNRALTASERTSLARYLMAWAGIGA